MNLPKPTPENTACCMVAHGEPYETMAFKLSARLATETLGTPVHIVRPAAEPDTKTPVDRFALPAFREKLRLFSELGEREWLLVIDADILLQKWDWDAIPKAGAFKAVRDKNFEKLSCSFVRGPLLDGAIFNTGLFFAHRSLATVFERAEQLMHPNHWFPGANMRCLFGEQGPLNRALLEAGTPVAALPERFNHVLMPDDSLAAEWIPDVYAWHVAGGEQADKLERFTVAARELTVCLVSYSSAMMSLFRKVQG